MGVDAFGQDIPHAILAEHEDGENWTHFLLVLKAPIYYPFKGIISDGDPAVQEAIKAVLPGVPYQLCVRHLEKELINHIRYHFTQKRGYWRGRIKLRLDDYLSRFVNIAKLAVLLNRKQSD